VLLSDTVGFIRTFRTRCHQLSRHARGSGTAEILLHVRDASSTYGEEQKARLRKCSRTRGVSKPRIEVLNKIDVLDAREREGLAARKQRGINYTRKYWSCQTAKASTRCCSDRQGLFSDP